MARTDDDQVAAAAAAAAPDAPAGTLEGRTLRRTVHVRHPVTHEQVALIPGEPIPEWAPQLVTNPAAWQTADEARATSFDVAGSNIAEVLEWVGDDPDRAAKAVELEQDRNGGPRQTLLDQLDRIAARRE